MNTASYPSPHTAYELRTAIETARLVLRPLRRSDAELVVGWRAQDAAQSLRPQPTIAEHLAWFASERRGRVDSATVEKAKGRPSGLVNFRDIDEAGQSAEVGKLIGGPSCRGRGYAQEATVAWLMYGFGELDLERVDAWTRSDNHASIHVDVKLGSMVTEERRFRDADARAELRKMTLTRQRFLEALREIDPSLAPMLSLARTRLAAAARRQR
jgi:[ribosomal protein S5]-alanine N-acetyltransferase